MKINKRPRRKLKVKWTVETNQELQSHYFMDTNMEEEFIKILAKELNQHLDENK